MALDTERQSCMEAYRPPSVIKRLLMEGSRAQQFCYLRVDFDVVWRFLGNSRGSGDLGGLLKSIWYRNQSRTWSGGRCLSILRCVNLRETFLLLINHFFLTNYSTRPRQACANLTYGVHLKRHNSILNFRKFWKNMSGSRSFDALYVGLIFRCSWASGVG